MTTCLRVLPSKYHRACTPPPPSQSGCQIQQEHALQEAPMLINESGSSSLAFIDHVSTSCTMVLCLHQVELNETHLMSGDKSAPFYDNIHLLHIAPFT